MEDEGMPAKLHPTLEAFVKAQNDHDTEALLQCFTRDALVHDEGRDYRGVAAIRAWNDDVIQKYRLSMEVRHVVERGDEIKVTSLVSGNFDGSPAELTYLFRIRDGKIAEFRA
jgi:ketosteroid isomerase-like protein